MRIILYNPSIPSPEIAKRLKNQVEEQRAYATLGRVHLLHGQCLADSSASGAMEQLKLAEKSFLRSLLLIKEYVFPVET